MVTLKSQFMSNLLKIMLWVLLGGGILEIVGMVAAAVDVEFFADHLYTPYSVIEITGVIVYYINIILYLIWIYRVHMDLEMLSPNFLRSPGKALAAILIPFYNLYGIPSIYREIGSHFSQSSQSLQKEGSWISRLAVPLLLFILAMNYFSRFITRAEEVSMGMLVANSVVNGMTYAIFLTLVILVSRGLNERFAARRNRQDDAMLADFSAPNTINV